jgi:hypothetical protein
MLAKALGLASQGCFCSFLHFDLLCLFLLSFFAFFFLKSNNVSYGN